MPIQFTTDQATIDAIAKIVEGVKTSLRDAGIEIPISFTATHNMNLNACHSNGCTLDMERMLEADPLDLLHDLAGIDAHINKSTGVLQNHFLPRYALRSKTMTMCEHEAVDRIENANRERALSL